MFAGCDWWLSAWTGEEVVAKERSGCRRLFESITGDIAE